jgi:hypothetical protein
MSYDSWKLDNEWDEAAKRIRRSRLCDDCNAVIATIAWDADTSLCERCAEKREEAEAEEDAFNDRVDYEYDRWHDQ